jgi:hypothetical protein
MSRKIISKCEPETDRHIFEAGGTFQPWLLASKNFTELLFQIPLCEMTTEKGELEEQLVRYSILNVENADKMFKERAIKLFAVRTLWAELRNNST